jgi:hypothetical protein
MLDPYGLPTLLMQSIPGQLELEVAEPNAVMELATPIMPFRRLSRSSVRLDEVVVLALAVDVVLVALEVLVLALEVEVVWTAAAAATVVVAAAAVDVVLEPP